VATTKGAIHGSVTANGNIYMHRQCVFMILRHDTFWHLVHYTRQSSSKRERDFRFNFIKCVHQSNDCRNSRCCRTAPYHASMSDRTKSKMVYQFNAATSVVVALPVRIDTGYYFALPPSCAKCIVAMSRSDQNSSSNACLHACWDRHESYHAVTRFFCWWSSGPVGDYTAIEFVCGGFCTRKT
jgi:hypothetical protein